VRALTAQEVLQKVFEALERSQRCLEKVQLDSRYKYRKVLFVETARDFVWAISLGEGQDASDLFACKVQKEAVTQDAREVVNDVVRSKMRENRYFVNSVVVAFKTGELAISTSAPFKGIVGDMILGGVERYIVEGYELAVNDGNFRYITKISPIKYRPPVVGFISDAILSGLALKSYF